MKHTAPQTRFNIKRVPRFLIRRGTDVRIYLYGITELRGRVCHLMDIATRKPVTTATMFDHNIVAFLDNGFYCRCTQLYVEDAIQLIPIKNVPIPNGTTTANGTNKHITLNGTK